MVTHTLCCSPHGVSRLKAMFSPFSFAKSSSAIYSLCSTDPLPFFCKSTSFALKVVWAEQNSSSLLMSIFNVSLMYLDSQYFIEYNEDFFNSSPLTVRIDAKNVLIFEFRTYFGICSNLFSSPRYCRNNFTALLTVLLVLLESLASSRSFKSSSVIAVNCLLTILHVKIKIQFVCFCYDRRRLLQRF